MGIVGLARQLQVWSLDSTPEAVSKWLMEQKVQVTAKHVRAMQAVHTRLSAIGADDVMEELESKCGADHALSKFTVLEVLCQHTKIDKNVGLQNSLLRWVLEYLRRCVLSKAVPADATREAIAAQVRAALLGRRIVTYLCTKLKMPDRVSPAPSGGQDAALSFRTRESYLKCFANHERFDQSQLGSNQNQAGDATWCADLMPFQQESITVLQQLMNCSPLYLEALLESTKKDPITSAEEALQQPVWVSLIDLPALLEARERDLVQHGYQQAPPVVLSTGAEAAAVAAESQVQSDQPSSTTGPASEQDEQTDAADEVRASFFLI